GAAVGCAQAGDGGPGGCAIFGARWGGFGGRPPPFGVVPYPIRFELHARTVSNPGMRHMLTAVAVGLAVARGSPPTSLQLKWELKEDVFPGRADERASRAAFTLTNRGA